MNSDQTNPTPQLTAEEYRAWLEAHPFGSCTSPRCGNNKTEAGCDCENPFCEICWS